MLLNKQVAEKNMQLFPVGIVPFPALHLPVGFKQAAQINQSATLVPCSKALVLLNCTSPLREGMNKCFQYVGQKEVTPATQTKKL